MRRIIVPGMPEWMQLTAGPCYAGVPMDAYCPRCDDLIFAALPAGFLKKLREAYRFIVGCCCDSSSSSSSSSGSSGSSSSSGSSGSSGSSSSSGSPLSCSDPDSNGYCCGVLSGNYTTKTFSLSWTGAASCSGALHTSGSVTLSYSSGTFPSSVQNCPITSGDIVYAGNNGGAGSTCARVSATLTVRPCNCCSGGVPTFQGATVCSSLTVSPGRTDCCGFVNGNWSLQCNGTTNTQSGILDPSAGGNYIQPGPHPCA